MFNLLSGRLFLPPLQSGCVQHRNNDIIHEWKADFNAFFGKFIKTRLFLKYICFYLRKKTASEDAVF